MRNSSLASFLSLLSLPENVAIAEDNAQALPRRRPSPHSKGGLRPTSPSSPPPRRLRGPSPPPSRWQDDLNASNAGAGDRSGASDGKPARGGGDGHLRRPSSMMDPPKLPTRTSSGLEPSAWLLRPSDLREALPPTLPVRRTYGCCSA